jgi:hypothetical protein
MSLLKANQTWTEAEIPSGPVAATSTNGGVTPGPVTASTATRISSSTSSGSAAIICIVICREYGASSVRLMTVWEKIR